MNRIAIIAIAALGCALPAQGAEPSRTSPGVSAPATRAPTDIRRTTIIVRSIENSLKLYRDVMGMTVNYDAIVETSGVALPAGKPGSKTRLVLLNANDPFIGWIGMMEWLDPKLGKAKPYPRRMTYGGVVIVTNTDDVDGRCAAAAKISGVTMTAPPRMQEYAGRNGAPPIVVRGCNFFDPDGILIEMNQLIR